MYYSHFGLKEPPFKITPNTEYFFNGSNRGAVLDALMYAITNGEGITKVVGEVGSGKTMLCRMLQSMLPDNVECVYLANPSVAPEDILHAIAFELSLKLSKNPDKLKVMQALQTYLLDRHEKGKQVIIFVEEAQGMPLATLEEIRLLSNLETKHDKLLQMVLFGQPELDDNLNQTHIRQLRERITHSFYLTPLDAKEVGEYLIFRLRAAGYYGPHLFEDKSIVKITEAAEGLIRRVNILADKALLAAFADNVYQVTPKHVKAAIKDSEFGAERAKVSKRKVRLFAVLGTLLVAVLLFGTLWVLKTQPQLAKQATAQLNWMKSKVVNLATPPDVHEKPTLTPTTEPAVKSAVPKAEAPKAESVVAPAVEQVVLAGPESVEDSRAPVVDESPSAVEDTQVPEENIKEANATDSAELVPAAEEVVAPKKEVSLGILGQRISATKEWMNTYPNDTITIQILGSSDVEGLKEQLKHLSRIIEMDQVYVYETLVNDETYHTVLYGSFDDRITAKEALKKLPIRVQKNKPHLRTIEGILVETNKSL